MEEREKVNSLDIKVYVNGLRNNPKYTQEVCSLVEADLEYGLTIEETKEYTSQRFNVEQMKAYSACLRKGYPEEIKECICKEDLSAEQMWTALEFYEKGVPLENIKDVLNNGGQTAFEMHQLFQSILERLKEVDEEAQKQGDYVKELVDQIHLVVDKISFQEGRYDALNEVLQELRKEKADTDMQEAMQKELAEKDTLLGKKQDELSEARAAIARYRNELETVKKEKDQLEQVVKDMEKKVMELEEDKLKEKLQEPESDVKHPPVDYKVAVMDANGKVISYVPVEYAKKKKNSNMLTTILSRVAFKRKIDIVKLVIENNLQPKQLVQVRNAIEQGLSDEQLLVLISNQIPAEQMEEIIQIAVYENNQKEE